MDESPPPMAEDEQRSPSPVEHITSDEIEGEVEQEIEEIEPADEPKETKTKATEGKGLFDSDDEASPSPPVEEKIQNTELVDESPLEEEGSAVVAVAATASDPAVLVRR